MQKEITQPEWLTEHKAEMLAHYLDLCKSPGAKDHAWHMVKRLDQTEMHKGIREVIVKSMNANCAKIVKAELHGLQ